MKTMMTPDEWLDYALRCESACRRVTDDGNITLAKAARLANVSLEHCQLILAGVTPADFFTVLAQNWEA